VTGEAGSGKTALIQEFSSRAQAAHPDLVIARGDCNAYTGIGDPYLPFREILALMMGDTESRWAAGAIGREQVRRVWRALPLTVKALLEAGPDLVDTFVSRESAIERATALLPSGAGWLTRLREQTGRRPTAPGMPGPQQSDVFEQYTRVLEVLARQVPLVLVLDDLQWADLGSVSMLFHVGRHLAGKRILILGAYRPEEVTGGRDGERHPLEAVANEFQRDFGEIGVSLEQADSRDFVEAYLDSEPNRLGAAFREMLYRQTRGHPLFTIELLRGLQERGGLVQDQAGKWAEGADLDWRALPARVEAAIRERISRLAEPLRTTLQVASVEGEVFTAEVVSRVLGADERSIVQRLSGELDRRHRLIRAQAIERLEWRRVSRYRFTNYLFQKYLYDSLDTVERAYLHEDVGNTLEELYGDKCGEIAVQLAWHFEEAGIPEKAIGYLHQAGDRAVRLSAYPEGRAHLSRGLELLMNMPDSPKRAQQELALQVSMGMAWMGDIPGPEWKNAYSRARELCRQMGKTSELCRVVGELSIFHYVRAEYHKAREMAEEALSLAEQAGDPLAVAVSHWHLGYSLFGLGEYAAARAHLGQTIAAYEPDQHQILVHLRGSDTGVSALAYDACCLWCLGFPEQASRRSQEALALARALDHAFTLADVLCFGGCLFNRMRRDARALRGAAEELIRLSTGMGFSSFGGTGTCYWGSAEALMGRTQEGITLIREGLSIRQSIGARCHHSGILGALAESQIASAQMAEGMATLTEALAMVVETGEHHWEAELWRVRSQLLLGLGDEQRAETSLQTAIEISRRQGARSWELRAATSLARLWLAQGRVDEASYLLAGIYGWFTEGFDTPDLVEARALLLELEQR
jgi:predicted ATPase